MTPSPASASPSTYIPGICNIGPAERAQRRRAGIIAAVATLVILVVLIATGVPRLWRLVLILPAAGAASGFLQDWFHFCAGFGMKGLYNVARSVGATDTVASAEFRRQDRRKAFLILGLSVGIGGVVTALGLII